ncbi:MAG: CoA-binding protein [Luteibaculum sp.]
MNANRETLVVGASTNPQRYSYLAIERLKANNIDSIMALGLKPGEVFGVPIEQEFPKRSVDTVTVYVGPKNQEELKNYLEKYPPKRIIFNPGTESDLMHNPALKETEVLPACTLVMLASNLY